MGLLSSSKKNAVTNNSTVNDNRVSVGEGASVIDLGGGAYDQSVTDNSLSLSDYSVNDSSDRSYRDNSVTTATDNRNYSVTDSSTSLSDYSVNDSSDRSYRDQSVTTATDNRAWDYSVNDTSDRSFTQNYNITALDGGAIPGIERVSKAAIDGSAGQLSAALDFGKGALDAANETTRTTAGLLSGVLGSQQEFARGFVADFYKSQQTEQERNFDRLSQLGTVAVLVIGVGWALARGR